MKNIGPMKRGISLSRREFEVLFMNNELMMLLRVIPGARC